MRHGLNIRPERALDFVSLGALVHRLDPGIVPFRKATSCAIHVSGGEFNFERVPGAGGDDPRARAGGAGRAAPAPPGGGGRALSPPLRRR